jgi:hypothetical protein
MKYRAVPAEIWRRDGVGSTDRPSVGPGENQNGGTPSLPTINCEFGCTARSIHLPRVKVHLPRSTCYSVIPATRKPGGQGHCWCRFQVRGMPNQDTEGSTISLAPQISRPDQCLPNLLRHVLERDSDPRPLSLADLTEG